ncbi:hypothetical protein BXY51_005434 [Actinoplanes cyaneus]|jgi:hypothetical protein|nr:hypothetical protein [Actinoplanes cyaneus]
MNSAYQFVVRDPERDADTGPARATPATATGTVLAGNR